MKTRFVIVAMPRTGTNRLVAQLQAQPDVWCHGEVLQIDHVYVNGPTADWNKKLRTLEEELLELRRVDTCAFFDRIFSLNYGRDHVGFKALFGKRQDWALTQSVVEDKKLTKIVLYRENVLATYSSHSLAVLNGAWNGWRMSISERALVAFSAQEFSQYLKNYRERYRSIFATLCDQRHFVLRYDELNEPVRLAALLQYLGTRTNVMPIKSPSVRGSPDILSRFSNPEVAEAYLREHGLMHWAYEGDVSL